jgi:hypothetical protein
MASVTGKETAGARQEHLRCCATDLERSKRSAGRSRSGRTCRTGRSSGGLGAGSTLITDSNLRDQEGKTDEESCVDATPSRCHLKAPQRQPSRVSCDTSATRLASTAEHGACAMRFSISRTLCLDPPALYFLANMLPRYLHRLLTSSQVVTRINVSGVPREHRSDCGRRQAAYIVADAHLLVPKLRTLSPHDSAATASRNDDWNRWSASGCWIWQGEPEPPRARSGDTHSRCHGLIVDRQSELHGDARPGGVRGGPYASPVSFDNRTADR